MTKTLSRERDIRHTGLYAEVLEFCTRIRRPGTGAISEITSLDVNPHTQLALFSGVIMAKLEGMPTTRICAADLGTGNVRVLTFGPNEDRAPKFSPDGQSAAFLSDREKAGDFQLYHLDPMRGIVRRGPMVEGRVEAFEWSRDGRCILLIVASSDSDSSSLQGAVAGVRGNSSLPSWLPSLERGGDGSGRREIWIYEIAAGSQRHVPTSDLTVWEAVWCGTKRIAAIASTITGEDGWYSAALRLIDATTGEHRLIHAPAGQIACLAAAASGQKLAIVEALASDRGSIAGDLLIVDRASGSVTPINTAGVDISSVAWRDDDHILAAGHRIAQTVVLEIDCLSGMVREAWASASITSIGRYMQVLPSGASGDGFFFAAQGFDRAPEITEVRNGEYRTVAELMGEDLKQLVGAAEHVTWKAPDDLEMEGWLLTPHGDGPFPLVTFLHGGPVWHWRPHWLGTSWALSEAMLLRHGYAIFLPNPRGSTGKGRGFVQLVRGDEGGADTHDILSGIDALVARGIADPGRLGVTGLSYGGFMSAWLITQDSRFAAAVPVSPGTDRISHMLTTNIPAYVRLFLRGRYDMPGGHYFARSPIMHAHKSRTPTLLICGTLDRCTPPEQAREFHSALLEHGGTSLLVTYPREGHGVRSFPAMIDSTARIVGWFEAHMPSSAQRSETSRNTEKENA